MTFDLFANTTRPDEALFFHRNEAGDARLGEIVRSQPADYASAKYVLLGCPQDEGVRRNGGRVGAAHAPDVIRTWLYRLVAQSKMSLFDLGNTIIQPTLEETHTIQQRLVRQIIADGKTLISLGGGNDISFPDCAGLSQVVDEPLVFNIDAHLDVRESEIRHSGTPYRMLLEGGFVTPQHFYEMGYQPYAVAESHLLYLRHKGVPTPRPMSSLRGENLREMTGQLLRKLKNSAIFWGIDMDVVHVSEAPGVSAPNSLGMSGEQLCQLVTLAAQDQRALVLEFTEVNPAYDIDNRTARLAAVAIWTFLSASASVEGMPRIDPDRA
jgi:formiminoglutamase